jgi:hypothetical protein
VTVKFESAELSSQILPKVWQAKQQEPEHRKCHEPLDPFANHRAFASTARSGRASVSGSDLADARGRVSERARCRVTVRCNCLLAAGTTVLFCRQLIEYRLDARLADDRFIALDPRIDFKSPLATK